MFKAQAGIFITHIPYRGTGLVLTDMLSGQIQMLMDNFVTAQPHIRDGKLKVLGVTSLKRLPFLPEVPTLDEQGLKGFDVANWFGIYAPRGTPIEIVRESTRRSTRLCRIRTCSGVCRTSAPRPSAAHPTTWGRWWLRKLPSGAS